MKRNSKNNHKNNKRNFHSQMEIMTNKHIGQMLDLNEEKGILLLQDPISKLYVVFVKKYLSSFYVKSYQMAEKHFTRLVALS